MYFFFGQLFSPRSRCVYGPFIPHVWKGSGNYPLGPVRDPLMGFGASKRVGAPSMGGKYT